MLLITQSNPHAQILCSFLISEEFSDITLVCGGNEYKVPVVLCAGSLFFAKMIRSQFKVQTKSTSTLKNYSPQDQEALTGVVDLTDDDPHVVEAVLNYLYCGHYTFDETKLHFWLDLLQHHAAVYLLADKWGVAPLKKLASDRFLADGRDAYCRHHEPEFLDIVQEIYPMTPENDDLRMAAAILVRKFVESEHLDVEEKERVKDIPGLGANLGLLYVGVARDPMIPTPCRRCRRPFDKGDELPLWATHKCSGCPFFANADQD